MDAAEIVRVLREYGIFDENDLNKKIQELNVPDISMFCNLPRRGRGNEPKYSTKE